MHCSPGEILQGSAARAQKANLQAIVLESGWPLLWRCVECGGFWESRYEGRYDEREYLTCLEHAEVRQRWPGILGKQVDREVPHSLAPQGG